MHLHQILFTFAFVLFAIGAYLGTTLGERLTRLGFALVMLVWLLS